MIWKGFPSLFILNIQPKAEPNPRLISLKYSLAFVFQNSTCIFKNFLGRNNNVSLEAHTCWSNILNSVFYHQSLYQKLINCSHQKISSHFTLISKYTFCDTLFILLNLIIITCLVYRFPIYLVSTGKLERGISNTFYNTSPAK